MKRKATDKLSAQAYRHILDCILRGDLPAGGEINRRTMAKELGMSLLPVSEALKRLELEMLVESGKRTGTRVRIPTPQEIRGFCIVREALETQAARLFNERARSDERLQLKESAQELDALYEESAERGPTFSESGLHQLRVKHKQFHLLIAECSGCPYLLQQVEVNLNLVFNSFYDRLFGDRRLPCQWHQALARELCESGAEAADAAARRHVRLHVQEIMYRLEPYSRLDHEKVLQSMARPD